MLKNSEELYDITIIGGGPAGLFAAFYAGLREMKTKMIEAQPRLGGKVHVYPEKMIWDVGGLTPISGLQLIEQMVEQGLTFQPTVSLNETLTKISKNDVGVFELETNKGNTHLSKTVIMAVGGGIVDPIKLPIENAASFEDGNLYYSVKSIKDFKGKTVLISGGGNSAVDWANELAPIAKHVTLIYRGGTLKGHEAEISKLAKNGVDYIMHTEITTLVGDHGEIKEVQLKNNQTQATCTLPVDAVIVNHGYNRDQKLMRNSKLNIELHNDYYIKGMPIGETSIPGLFAAGDILHHEGKLHLIAGAYQDAANAVNCAKLFLEPDAMKTARVSSHNDIFAEKNKKYIYG